MTEKPDFALPDFLPYLLNQAAEASSAEFQQHYRMKYGMLRNEWRVLFHLGCYGPMTAKQICDLASLHKTKVSRAVGALSAKRMLMRETVPTDRRNEILSLTRHGASVFADLSDAAQRYDAKLCAALTVEEVVVLRSTLRKLAGL